MTGTQSDKSDNHAPQWDFGPIYNLEPDLLIMWNLIHKKSLKRVAHASQIQFQTLNIPAK